MSVDRALARTLRTVRDPQPGVYPLEALKNAQAPFLCYRRQLWQREECLEGPAELQEALFEVDAVGSSHEELLALCDALEGTMTTLRGQKLCGVHIERVRIRQESPDLREREVGLYRRMYAITINYQDDDTEG